MATRDYEFQEDRTTLVREQLLETIDGTTAGKDVSGAGLAIRFRMYAVAGTLLVDEVLTKVEITGGDYPDTSPAKSGAQGYIRPTSSGQMICRLVLVDTATPDAETPTEDREFVWLEWTTRVQPSPQP